MLERVEEEIGAVLVPADMGGVCGSLIHIVE